MNTQDYIDLLMAHYSVSSIYALAQHLGLRETTVRTWKKGGTIGQEHAHLVGDVLGIDPAIIMADMAAESAQNERVRDTWAKLADSLRSHVAAVAALSVGLVGSAAASSGLLDAALSASPMYIM